MPSRFQVCSRAPNTFLEGYRHPFDIGCGRDSLPCPSALAFEKGCLERVRPVPDV